MTIIVVNDVVSESLASRIEQMFFGFDFPWYYNNVTVGATYPDDGNTIEGPQFTHMFVREGNRTSNLGGLAEALVHILAEKTGLVLGEPFRVKANLNVQNNTMGDAHYPAHVDEVLDVPFLTCVYYVNDCDGDTVFFDDDMKEIKRLTPKKGTLVYFDGNIRHAGCPPKKALHRCVININFLRQHWLKDEPK